MPQNLIIQSDARNNVSWIATASSITPNAVANPRNGAVTTDALVDNNLNTTHFTSSLTFATTIKFTYTFSAIVKSAKAGTPAVLFSVSGAFAGGGTYFDLTNGTKQDSGLGNGEVSSSLALGNGWYLIKITGLARGAVSGVNIFACTALGAATYVGDSTAALYIDTVRAVQANWEGEYCLTTTSQVNPNTPPRNKATNRVRVQDQENLIVWASDLTQSPWQWQGPAPSAVQLNQVANPLDGALTACGFLDKNATNANFNIRTNVTASMAGNAGQTETFSFYVKAGTQTWCAIGVNNAVQINWFNISTGQFGLCQSGSANCSARALSNGWWRVSVTFTQAAGASGQIVVIYAAPSDTIVAYTGTGQNAIFVYLPQVNHGNFAGAPVLTNATAVNNGPLRNKISRDSQNLLTFSEQFDNAIWTKVHSSASANTIANPVDGAVTADTLVDDSTNNIHQLSYAPSPVQNSLYTFSVFLKANALGFAQIQINGNSAGIVGINLNTGAVAISAGALTGGSESWGNGWWRVWVTKITDAATTSCAVISATSVTTGSAAYLGTSANAIYIFGAQLTRCNWPGEYTQVVASSAGGNTPPRNRILPTNVVGDSNDMSTAAWVKTTGVTVTANTLDVLDPIGGNTANKLVYDGSGSAGSLRLQQQSLISVGFGLRTALAAAIWLRLPNGAGTRTMGVNANVTPSLSFTVTEQWQRFLISPLVVNTTAGAIFFNLTDVVVNSAGTIYTWQPQLNRGLYVSPYIATPGGASGRVDQNTFTRGIMP